MKVLEFLNLDSGRASSFRAEGKAMISLHNDVEGATVHQVSELVSHFIVLCRNGSHTTGHAIVTTRSRLRICFPAIVQTLTGL